MAPNNLRTIRLGRDLALWGLAAKAGVSATTLSAVERWGYAPSPEVRRRIAEALGVHVESIWPVSDSHETDREIHDSDG